MQRFGRVMLFNAPPIAPTRLMTITDVAPTAPIVADAVVTRMALDRPQWRAEKGDPALRTGTVYDAGGLPVPVHAMDLRDQKGLMIVRADEPTLAVKRKQTAEPIPGRHIYAGDLKQHFGHFMLESLCRAWAFADRAPGAKLIFHGGAADPDQAITPFMRFFLESFGVGPEDVLIANRDLQVEELVVPSSQYDLGVRADIRFAANFDRIRRHHCPELAAESLPKRIYFTRRAVHAVALEKLQRARRSPRAIRWAFTKMVANEDELEHLFAARGFVVVAPESLPLARQIKLAANADVMAGITGTALHHALFATNPRARIISVATRFSQNQIAIEQLKELRSAHIFRAGPRTDEQPVTMDLDMLARALAEIEL